MYKISTMYGYIKRKMFMHVFIEMKIEIRVIIYASLVNADYL